MSSEVILSKNVVPIDSTIWLTYIIMAFDYKLCYLHQQLLYSLIPRHLGFRHMHIYYFNTMHTLG